VIEIQCPRCKQYWYSEADEGRVRLCDRCHDDLRRKRGPRAEVDIPFLIGLGMVVVFDLMLITLTALMPAVFGRVLLGSAVVLLIAGTVIFRVLRWEGAIDWRIGRWALLSLLSGFAFLLAYGSFLGLRR
jgi:hypothetical protein